MRYLILLLLLFALPVSAAEIVKTIGTNSRDYATIQAWEDDLDDGTNAANDATAYQSGDTARGDVYNDSAFDEDVTINGGGTVGLIYRTLTVPVGERHDGVAASAGGAAGARLVMSANSRNLQISRDNTDVEWLEIDENDKSVGFTYGVGGSDGVARNMIIHNALTTGNPTGISIGAATIDILNNIVYNIIASTSGNSKAISSSAGAGKTQNILNNTIFNITSDSGNADGLIFTNDNANKTIKNNIAVDAASNSGTAKDFNFPGTNPTSETNLSSDDTADDALGSGHLINKAAGDQFVSTVGGSEDLHLKSGADAIDVGTDLGTSPTGVNFDIDNRDRDAEGDIWDMGADELVAAAGVGMKLEGGIHFQGGIHFIIQ